MKKILITLTVILISLSAFSQIEEEVITAWSLLEAKNVVVINGDTIELDSPSDGQFIRRVSGKWINQSFSATGTDSTRYRQEDNYLLDYRGGSIFDSTRIYFKELLFDYDTDGKAIIAVEQSATDANGNDLVIYAGDGTGDSSTGGDLWLRAGAGYGGQGYILIGQGGTDTIYINSVSDHNNKKITNVLEGTDPSDVVTVSQLDGLSKIVYQIILPSSSSVNGRIQTPTSLPDGWTLTDDGINLIITHNLDRWSANVTVKANTSGTIWDQQLNTAAYSYYSDLSSNQIKIYSLCTAYKPIRINIIFE